MFKESSCFPAACHASVICGGKKVYSLCIHAQRIHLCILDFNSSRSPPLSRLSEDGRRRSWGDTNFRNKKKAFFFPRSLYLFSLVCVEGVSCLCCPVLFCYPGFCTFLVIGIWFISLDLTFFLLAVTGKGNKVYNQDTVGLSWVAFRSRYERF